jgi:hypothetical protein
MAVTVAGRRISTPTLRKWRREVEQGKRTLIEIERDELGTYGRGKTISRLFASELEA